MEPKDLSDKEKEKGAKKKNMIFLKPRMYILERRKTDTIVAENIAVDCSGDVNSATLRRSQSDRTEYSKKLKEKMAPQEMSTPPPSPTIDLEELKKRMMGKRSKVIHELVQTEKDYLIDLELCIKEVVQPLRDIQVVDVDRLFINIESVSEVSAKLLSKLEEAIAEADPQRQIIGEAFIEIKSSLEEVYKIYCYHHDDANSLLKSYEKDEEVKRHFRNCVLSLKGKPNLLDMGSLMIKPVQRVMKYPLLLGELWHSTPDCHPDNKPLEEALAAVKRINTNINEFKRRKDIVMKYKRNEELGTLMNKLNRLSIHSFRKNASRVTSHLKILTGGESQVKDERFDKEEKMFRNLEKAVRQLGKNVYYYFQHTQEIVSLVVENAEELQIILQDPDKSDSHAPPNKKNSDNPYIHFVKDERFDKEEKMFRNLEKAVRQLGKNVYYYFQHTQEIVSLVVENAEELQIILQDLDKSDSHAPPNKKNSDNPYIHFEIISLVVQNAEELQIILQDTDKTDRNTPPNNGDNPYIHFKEKLERMVLIPLSTLQSMFSAPQKLIQKRYDKLLDYDSRLERSSPDELEMARRDYEALNAQLVEELQVFNLAAKKILINCIYCFVALLRDLMDSASRQSPSIQNLLAPFSNIHEVQNSVMEELNNLIFVKENTPKLVERKLSFDKPKKYVHEIPRQSEAHRSKLLSSHSPDKLYQLKRNCNATQEQDLSLFEGELVAVLEQQDPFGSTSRWLVDTGMQNSVMEELNNLIFVKENTPKLVERKLSFDKPKKYVHEIPRQSEAHRSKLLSSHSPDKLYQLKRNCNATQEQDLSLFEGELVAVLEQQDPFGSTSRWLVDTGSQQGYVYSSFLKQYNHTKEYNGTLHKQQEDFDNISLFISGNGSSSLKSFSIARSDSSSSINGMAEVDGNHSCGESDDQQIFYAVYAFEARSEQELSLQEYQHVRIVKFCDVSGNKDWWLAEANGQKGYVPANYLGKMSYA
ncbi:UNVERIFIED_CONTAM: hypothetical protein FKN15_031970 [Acipenser sinensis]